MVGCSDYAFSVYSAVSDVGPLANLTYLLLIDSLHWLLSIVFENLFANIQSVKSKLKGAVRQEWDEKLELSITAPAALKDVIDDIDLKIMHIQNTVKNIPKTQ